VAGKPDQNGGAATLEEPGDDFYRPPTGNSGTRRSARDSRSEDDNEAGEPFLRARRRVPIRRGILPAWARTRWGRFVFAACVLAVLGGAIAALWQTSNLLHHDPRFTVASSSSIQIVGNSELTRANLLSVFGSDIGRNLFYVPLQRRRRELEQIPWVEHATVMRILPDQIRVAVEERRPIAFAEVKGQIELVDAAGVLLHMSPREMAAKHYSFPVVTGIRPGDAPAARAARMQVYQRFVQDLTAGGQNVPAQFSEIDLGDPDDLKATVASNGAGVLLYCGHEDFLPRWQNYQAHIAQWRAQYPNLASVDLRYSDEVVLKMANPPAPPAAKPAPVKSAPARTAARKHKARETRRPTHSRARRRTR
jgi:cell division protein FtsQ